MWIYYFIKPVIPRRLRWFLRRQLATRQRKAHALTWPIHSPAAKTPEGWPGWPSNKRFALVLTHDVEGQKGADRCRELVELEMRMGFRSSFNFIPEGSYETLLSLREFLVANGFEIGIHDLKHDGKLYRSRSVFSANAERINHYLKQWQAVGFRSGFMLHRLNWLHDLNILYDTSTFDTDPFEPQPDGTHTIFPFWVAGKKRAGYVELPYTLPQDSTLFLLFRERNIETWKRKLDWIAEHGGMALVNVHPDYLNFTGRNTAKEYSVERYREFLGYVTDRYAGQYWSALPREVAQLIRDTRHRRLDSRTSEDLEARGVPHTLEKTVGNSPQLDGSEANPPETGSRAQLPDDCDLGTLHGKRAAVVVFSYYPADPRVRRAAEALVQQGMSVEVICLRQTGSELQHGSFNGVDIFRVPLKRHRGGKIAYVWQYLSFILVSSAMLASRQRRRHYDVVHVHNMPDMLAFSAFVPKLFGARVILDLHDPMPELMMTIFGLRGDSLSVRLLKRLEKLSIRFVDRVLTVNLACKKIFGARSCPPEKIQVIMNSPDEGIFEFRPFADPGLRKSGQPFVLMFHGSIVERHGLDLAVQALAAVRKSIPAAELRIYGQKTPFLEQVMNSLLEPELQNSVRYLGAKNLEQIAAAIDECDVGVIPNRRSIFTELNTPTRIFEYLARGKPVIAPAAPGIEDYFDREQLIFFQLGDADDLARRIEYVYAHPDQVGEIVKRGQRVYLDHLWSREKSRFVNLVADLFHTDERD